jgi:integrase
MGERVRIGLRQIQGLQPGEVIWDSIVGGLGARRQRSNAVSYFVYYRTSEGRQRWHTIGRHGAWLPDTARAEARRLLGDVARGEDPAGAKHAGRKAITVSEFCDQYLLDAKVGLVLSRFGQAKKTSTLLGDRGRIERHVKPILGKLKVAAVTDDDVRDLRDAIAGGKTAGNIKTGPRGLARVTGGKGAATRTLRLLGGIFSYAVQRKLRADNPVKGVPLFKDGARTRRLSPEEYRALGKALKKAHESGMWPPAVAAARFLALTGWRHSEALCLHWRDVDITKRTAHLGTTKTGYSMRPLSKAACAVLRSLPRAHELVFPASRGNGPMTGLKKRWKRISKLGNLAADISPHVLRHSFASVAADLGYSDITIGALIGHRGRSMTSRYSHAADAVLLAAADAVAEQISEPM